MTIRATGKRALHLEVPKQPAFKPKPKPQAAVARPLRDELSTGEGSALRRRGLAVTGATLTGTALQSQAPTFKATEVPAVDAPQTDPAADAERVQQAWDDELASSGDPALAARAASQELEALIEKHPDDPAYADTLVREANGTLEQIAVVLGEASEGHDHDKGVVRETIAALSNAAAAGGAVTALAIGDELAQHVDDDGELHYFDDAFYSHVEEGGNPALFQATYQALRAQGKDDAAGKLQDKNGGLLDEAIEFGTGLAGEVIGGVVDVVGTLAGGAWHLATDAGEFAVDVAEGTIDAVGDVTSWSADQLKNATEYAIEQGLELTGELRDEVRSRAIEAMSDVVDLDAVDDLGPGDSWSVGSAGWVGAGLGGQAAGEIKVEVKTNPETGEDEYVVSGMLTADIGVAVGATAMVGAEGKVEFTFDNAADAKAAVETMMSAAVAASAVTVPGIGTVAAGILAPSPGELGELTSHLSAIEVTGEVAAELDAQYEGILGPVELGAGGEAGGEISTGYRVEFEEGHATELIRITEAEGTADWADPIALLHVVGGDDPLLENASRLGDLSASATIRVEQSIPLDGSGDISPLEFLTDPTAALRGTVTGDVSTSVSISGEVKGGDEGFTVSATLEDVTADDVTNLGGALLTGDLDRLGSAFEELTPELDADHFTEDRDELEIDYGAFGVGFEFEVYRQTRNFDDGN